MPHVQKLGILVVTLALVLGSAQSDAASFNTDLEGWTSFGFEIDAVIGFPAPTLNSITLVSTAGDMVHAATGGNPGGYASLTDAIESPASWARAPQSFIPNGGDLSGIQTLSFDHRLFDNGIDDNNMPAEIFPYAAIFISGDPTDLNAIVWTSPAPAGPTEWVEFDIAINETNFQKIETIQISTIDPSLAGTLIGNTRPADVGLTGTMSFAEILANVTEILIPFEISNNTGNQMSESAGIDNVALVPEPGLLGLVLVAGAALRLRRR